MTKSQKMVGHLFAIFTIVVIIQRYLSIGLALPMRTR